MSGFQERLETFGDYTAVLDMLGTGVVVKPEGDAPEVFGAVSAISVDSEGVVTLQVGEDPQVYTLSQVRTFKRPPGGGKGGGS